MNEHMENQATPNFSTGQALIERLLPYIHDEMRMPAGLIKDVIEEIERLQKQNEEKTEAVSSMRNMLEETAADRGL